MKKKERKKAPNSCFQIFSLKKYNHQNLFIVEHRVLKLLFLNISCCGRLLCVTLYLLQRCYHIESKLQYPDPLEKSKVSPEVCEKVYLMLLSYRRQSCNLVAAKKVLSKNKPTIAYMICTVNKIYGRHVSESLPFQEIQ